MMLDINKKNKELFSFKMQFIIIYNVHYVMLLCLHDMLCNYFLLHFILHTV